MFVWNFCFNYVIQGKWVKKYTPAYIYINKEGYAWTKSENGSKNIGVRTRLSALLGSAGTLLGIPLLQSEPSLRSAMGASLSVPGTALAGGWGPPVFFSSRERAFG